MQIEGQDVGELNSCYPRSQKRDLGHPFIVGWTDGLSIFCFTLDR